MERVTQTKKDFLARMSHDLRTPMNAIIGLTALTIDDADNPDMVRENMAKMRTASDFMMTLINDMLDVAQMEERTIILQKEPYVYSDFLMSMRTMFQSACQQKNITLAIQEPKVNPTVLVDKTRLNQIFFHLFSNAVKYTNPGGHISFLVENLKESQGTISADFVVEDTGIGMSRDFLEHMFEPFTWEDERVTPHLQGSGLGLSIVRQLVELMDGQISIQSTQGKGTRVTVSLLFERMSKEEIADFKQACEDACERAQVQDTALCGKRVLLVEDHPMNAVIAQRLLEKKNMVVIHAENGKVAVEKFKASQEGSFDIILTDIRMPEMSGLEAAEMIRAMDRSDAGKIPIIAMSANTYAQDRRQSMAAGMNEHLGKPVDVRKLYSTMEHYLTP